MTGGSWVRNNIPGLIFQTRTHSYSGWFPKQLRVVITLSGPTKYRHQIICGVIVAAVSYVTFEWIGAVYYLLAGVLVGNIWEAWRRYGFPGTTTKRARPGRA